MPPGATPMAALCSAYSASADVRVLRSVHPGTASASAVHPATSPWLPSIIATPASATAIDSAPSASPTLQRKRSAAAMLSRSAVSRSSQGSCPALVRCGSASTSRSVEESAWRRRNVGQLAALGEPFDAELADRLEHADAVPVAHPLEQRLVDQRGEQVGDVTGRELVVGAHRRRAVPDGAGGKDREPLDQPALGVRQQLPAPLDDGVQRAVPRQCGAAAAGQQPEAVVQPRRDLGDRQRA